MDLILPTLGLLLLAGLLLFWLIGLSVIPNDRIGILEKRWSAAGSIQSGFIALNGEAGFQPQVLRGGAHWRMPFQFAVHRMPLVTIPQGKIGYVFARDGRPLDASQALGSNEVAQDFQDATGFLAAGGQKGPQRRVLREGTYAINLAQFVVLTSDHLYYLPLNKDDAEVFQRMSALIQARHGFEPVILSGAEDCVGVVTVHEGPALSGSEIIAPVVGIDPKQADSYHNSFQDAERFLKAGGRRGRQLLVLVEGTYFINRLFATVESIPKLVVEVGTVGVVVSYTGETGKDLSGTDYKHGELVLRGARGVWNEPLLPGKYAFNTFAGKVVMVPTTNFILKWNKREVGAHKFDENLSEVSLITKDAFEPSLPLSVVVHIDYRKAPLVIQRFGDIRRLVEQTLDPMVAAYFKNVGQTRTVIQLLQDRSLIQQEASIQMREKFEHYNLELEEVLIGTPGSSGGDKHIDEILAQLRERQIAEEKVATYLLKEKAAVQERMLNEAQARAAQQRGLTESELSIQILSNQGKAETQRVVQQANQMKTMAEAEAEKIRRLSEAEADKIKRIAEADAERAARVGIAEAMAIEEQVLASGGPRYQMTREVLSRFADAVATAKVDVVPRIVMSGGEGKGGHGLLDTLVALMVDDRMQDAPASERPRRPEVEALREELLGRGGRPKA